MVLCSENISGGPLISAGPLIPAPGKGTSNQNRKLSWRTLGYGSVMRL